MAEIIKMVKLQSNTRGSWRDVLEFDASNDYLTSQIMYAAALLFDNVPGATLRIIIPTNTALVRSESIDDLCVHTCQLAQAALMRCIERHHRLGVWGFDALALQTIPAAIDLHESILELSRPTQMQDAMRETLLRMRRGDIYDAAVEATK